MSHKLFVSDNLTIMWDKRLNTPTLDQSISNYLVLTVSILVNWKLKTFQLEFWLDKAQKFWLIWDYYTFTNWYEWETFRKTIESLGYSFWDFSISRAIEELTWEQSITVQEV